MRRSLQVPIFAMCSVMIGCSSDARRVDTSDAGPPVIRSHDGVRVCEGVFFDAHPASGTTTDSTGFAMPQPFAACGSEFTVLVGTADYASVASRVAASGYEPVRLAGDRTAVALYLVEFNASDVGNYTEFALAYNVVAQGTPNDEIPWVNEYSALVPAFLPTTEVFLDRFVLQRGEGDYAIRAGREFVGLDKQPGEVSISHTGGETLFTIADQDGGAVLQGRTVVDVTPEAQLAEANQLALAFGLPDASALPAPPAELYVPLVNDDMRSPGEVFTWAAIFNQPTTALAAVDADEEVNLGDGELGQRLSSMSYTPAVIVRYFDVDVVYPPSR